MYSQIPKNLTKDNEVKALRTANAKFFRDIAGKGIANFHTGHIHYFNKDKVGDGEERWREIDWNLIWDEKKKGWGFKYHNFQPFLPEYADDWVEFRDLWDGKDQMIKYRAVADRVKGRLVLESELADNGLDKLTFANCVVYDNAFGEGIDLILYFTRSQLKKVVRIHNASKDPKGMSFDFEVDFPNGKKLYRQNIKSERQELYRDKNTKKVLNFREYDGYELEMRDKEFDSNKRLMVGNDNQDGREWFTHIKPFLAWDNNGLLENIKVDFYINNGKTYIRKKISPEFIAKSLGDIFTDTTTSYYAGAGDGATGYRNVNGTVAEGAWDAVHDYATADVASSAGTEGYLCNAQVAQATDPYNSRNTLYRSFFPTDTSGIPDDNSVTAATFNFFVITGELIYEDNDSQAYVGLVQTSQASTNEVVAGDYDQCGDVNNPAKGGQKDLDTMTANQYNVIDLDATGLSWIDKTGITKIGAREGHDIEDAPIVYGSGTYTTNAAYGYFSEQTGTGSDPYLSVTYVDSSSSSSSSSSQSNSSSSSFSSSSSSSFSSSSSSSSFSSSSSSSSSSQSSSSSSSLSNSSFSSSSSSSSSFSSSSSSFSSCSSSSSFSSSSSSSSSSFSSYSFSSSSSSSLSFSSSSSSFSSSSSSSNSHGIWTNEGKASAPVWVNTDKPIM